MARMPALTGAALVHPVGAGDGLHQRVGFERLVEVAGGEARHMEAGQPPGVDDGDTEKNAIMGRFLPLA